MGEMREFIPEENIDTIYVANYNQRAARIRKGRHAWNQLRSANRRNAERIIPEPGITVGPLLQADLGHTFIFSVISPKTPINNITMHALHASRRRIVTSLVICSDTCQIREE
jgi:hypothetical protein